MLTQDSLYSREHYARLRPIFRALVIEHKKERRVPLGDHVALHFEDDLTMLYQVQEMLRPELAFAPDMVQDELDRYNPLVPDGSNWKASFMVEYVDDAERRPALMRLVGIERCVWMQVAGCEVIRAQVNEDLEGGTPDRNTTVHFMRFELTPAMVASAKSGAAIFAGIDHPACQACTQLAETVRASLAGDLA
jgi:hypothetical protein